MNGKDGLPGRSGVRAASKTARPTGATSSHSRNAEVSYTSTHLYGEDSAVGRGGGEFEPLLQSASLSFCETGSYQRVSERRCEHAVRRGVAHVPPGRLTDRTRSLPYRRSLRLRADFILLAIFENLHDAVPRHRAFQAGEPAGRPEEGRLPWRRSSRAPTWPLTSAVEPVD